MKKFIGFFGLAIIVLVLFSGCSSEKASNTSQPIIKASLSDAIKDGEVETVKSALDVFSKAFQPFLKKYSDDIEWFRVESLHNFTGDGMAKHDYRYTDYKWNKYIYIQFKIKDDPKKIPNNLNAWGHTEHIYLGGPKNPGISITKFPELFGGTQLRPGANGFVSAPDLAKIF